MQTKLMMLIFLAFFTTTAYAQDSTTIEIQKTGGRTEALVLGTEPAQEKPTGFFGKSFYHLETGIITTAQFASSMVGKVTDSTVFGVQKTSDVFISPIVKTLDIKRWGHKK